MDPQSKLQELCETEQKDLLEQLYNKSGWRKETDLGVGNEAIAAAHEERTILELIQNARDAIQRGQDSDRADTTDRSGSVAIIVGPNSLYVANTGNPFELNDDDVFEAVTALNRSDKVYERGAIGEKGVGMKSILRSAEQFSIHSVVDNTKISAGFSRSQSTEMLLEVYNELLSREDFRAEIDPEGESDVVDHCVDAIETTLESAPPTLPSSVRDEVVTKDLDTLSTIPPNPVDVLQDLPRLSLFRYPFAKLESDHSDDTDLTDLLLHSTSTDRETWQSLGETLQSRLENHKDRYRTVIKLSYTDEQWRSLLDTLEDSLASSPISDHHPTAVQQFSDEREDVAGTDETPKEEQIWAECRAFDPETLVLLGEIGSLHFLKLEAEQSDNTLGLQERRKIEIRTCDRESVDQESDISCQKITAEVERESTDTTDRTREFHEYAQSVDLDIEGEADDEELGEPIRLLFEHPDPETGQWQPKRHPLHLFYPIEEAETPFPFVIHAPFRVGLDRQELQSSPINTKLLDQLPEFIRATASDLVRAIDEENYRNWMPWLVMPLQGDAETPIASTLERTTQRLSKTPIVPSHSGDVLTPQDVLFDPEQPLAFEPLRHNHEEGSVDAPPIPAKAVIENGRCWIDRVNRTDTESTGDFRTIAKQLGLTTIVDRPFDEDHTDLRGLISILGDLWGIKSEPAEADSICWHMDVDRKEHGEQYFSSICAALDRFEETTADQDTEADPVEKLGEWYIPLLPAEEHTDSESQSQARIATLVRASKRRTGGPQSQQGRNDRIVFRRSEGSDQASIDLLGAPPQSLDVYITPFDKDWIGTLQANYEEWGTRELEGPATYYQRIAAEIGGFSDSDTTNLEFNNDELSFLVNLYYTVTEEATGRTAAWLNPVPYHNRKFTAADQHTGVIDLLKGNSLTSLPEDYDTFLERRYSQCVPLPTKSGTDTRAEHIVFGREWADAFRSVADRLDDGKIIDPFAEDADNPRTRIANLRRWAKAIETAARYRTDGTPILAPPGDKQWNGVLDELEVPSKGQDLWVLNFLLHVGVQVGPHIEWGWLLPSSDVRDRRTGALQLTETQELTRGSDATLESLPLSPTTEELERYKEICWRTEHHPGFSADHTSNCRDNFLDCSPDEWVEAENNDVAVPTWWRFTELDTNGRRDVTEIRQAILLMWPELEASLFETSWICTDTGHYIQSPESTIPALGLVQLRNAPLWPGTWPKDGVLANKEWAPPYNSHLNPASKLVYNPSDGGGGQHIEQTLPTIDSQLLIEEVNNGIEAFDLSSREIATTLGAKPVDELTPAEAAEQLNWVLTAAEAIAPKTSPSGLGKLRTSNDETSLRRSALGLLRRLGAREHIRGKIPDKNDDQQRVWQRRDVWHTGTRVLINDGGEFKTISVGDGQERPDREIGIYTERLPSFAREILEDQSHLFVEVPTNRPGPLAYILGDSPTGGEDVQFDIVRKTKEDIPKLEKATGPSIADDYQDDLEKLATEIETRIPYLIAAFDRVHNSQSELESVYTQLEQTVSNDIGIVYNPNRSSKARHSAQWQPTDTQNEDPNRIAIFKNALSDTSADSIPLYYAADGLLQVIDDTPSQRAREAFENVLMKNREQLERDYEETITEIERQITALNTDRLRRIHRTLDELMAHFNTGDSIPAIDWTTIDAKPALDSLTSVASDDTTELREDIEPLRTWLETLCQATPLSREDAKRCILASKSTDPETVRRVMVRVSDRTEDITLEELATAEHWSVLEEWPPSGDADDLEKYLKAVSKVKAFWAIILDAETPGLDIVNDAIVNADRQSAPSPVTQTTTFCPRPAELPDSLQYIPLVTLIHRDDGPVPPTFRGVVDRWCEDKKDEVLELDVLFEDKEVTELFDGLCTAIGTPAQSLDKIRDEFSEFRKSRSTPSIDPRDDRKRRTEEWYSEDSPFAELDFSGSEAIDTASPENGSSPSVGNRSGQPNEHENAEIAADRGRDAELICLERSWGHFKSASSQVREEILELLNRWRSYEKWRMKSVDDVITDANATNVASLDGYTDAKELLTATEFEDEVLAKSTFQALFDVAEERGPGFDYIDPFGYHYGTTDSSEWSRDNMRRVEVKAVMPTRVRKGRFKLTGNEFRMACRPGPSAEEDASLEERVATWQYLVRIVLLPEDWRSKIRAPEAIEMRDIQDVARFGDLHGEQEPVWEKLRGGKFYVNFEIS